MVVCFPLRASLRGSSIAKSISLCLQAWPVGAIAQCVCYFWPNFLRAACRYSCCRKHDACRSCCTCMGQPRRAISCLLERSLRWGLSLLGLLNNAGNGAAFSSQPYFTCHTALPISMPVIAKLDGTLLPRDFGQHPSHPQGDGALGIVLLVSPHGAPSSHEPLGFLLLQKSASKTATFGMPVSEPVPGNGKPFTELTVHPSHCPSFSVPSIGRGCFFFWQMRMFAFVCFNLLGEDAKDALEEFNFLGFQRF